MTESHADIEAEPENSKDDTSRWQRIKPPFKTWIKERTFLGMDRRPAYRITQNGIVRDWFDFNDTDSLPFDRETYQDTQIFLGDYANPWYVDIDSIKEHYDEFGHNEPITNLVEAKHIIPSQKYKNYMNQAVLTDTFNATGFRTDRFLYVLYAVLGVSALNLLVMIT